jgi:7,8-dihydroneopterin aldolase/epimerase/oxygenase
MDIIFLRGLTIETIIGIYDWERKTRQTIILDIEMATDIRNAAQSDAIEDTLDYKAVSKRLIDYVEQSEFFLVETLAETISQLIMEEFNVPWVRLTVNKKGAIRGASDVGIIIERGEQPANG